MTSYVHPAARATPWRTAVPSLGAIACDVDQVLGSPVGVEIHVQGVDVGPSELQCVRCTRCMIPWDAGCEPPAYLPGRSTWRCVTCWRQVTVTWGEPKLGGLI